MTVRMLVIPKPDFGRPLYNKGPACPTPTQLSTVAWCYSTVFPDADKPLVCESFNTVNFAHDGRYAAITSGDEIAPFYTKLRKFFVTLPERAYLVAEFPHGASVAEEALAPRIGHVAARAGWLEPPEFIVTGPMMRLAIPSFEMGAKFRMFWTPED